jgi:hypothetical protein
VEDIPRREAGGQAVIVIMILAEWDSRAKENARLGGG